MTWSNFLPILLVMGISIAAFRVIPLLVLSERSLSDNAQSALGLVPAAAFAALVVNDLFKPDAFSAGVWSVSMPIIAAIGVIVVAKKTKSLVICAVAGVIIYAILSFLPIV